MDNINIFLDIDVIRTDRNEIYFFNKFDLCLCTAFFTERSDVI